MVKRNLIINLLIGVLITMGSLRPISMTYATTEPPKSGLTITPSMQQVTVVPNQPERTFSVQLTNRNKVKTTVALQAVDFGSLDESGGVLFQGTGTELQAKYGLSKWLSFDQQIVEVDSGETKKILVRILNDDTLTPGGHYGAVLFRPVSAEGQPGQIGITQIASMLVFVTKTGGEQYRMQFTELKYSGGLFAMPRVAEVTFKNSGNVHIVPRGTIDILDPFDRVALEGTINIDSGIVLPETTRTLSVPLRSSYRFFLPGKYKAKLTFRYDGMPTSKTYEVQFRYIGWFALTMGLFAIGIIFLIVRNRRKIKKMVKMIPLLGKSPPKND